MRSFFVYAVATEDLISDILETKMVFAVCKGSFNTTSSFKTLDLTVSRLDGGVLRFYKLKQVLSRACILKEYEKIKEKLLSVKFKIVNGNEGDLVQELASSLNPICETVLLEKKARYEEAGYATGEIGLGTFHTWHGTPDMRLVGLTEANISVLVSPLEPPEELEEPSEELEEPSEDDEPAVPVPVEVKTNLRASSKSVLSQLVALTVTSSFTYYNLRGVDVTLALLMCCKRVRICMYDCTNDLLSLSDEISLLSSDGTTSLHGVLMIWISIYFRYVCTQCNHSNYASVRLRKRGIRVASVSVCVGCYSCSTINEVLIKSFVFEFG